jgi:hypothetical protein
MPITYEANFEAGSLGLSLTQENTVVSVASGGQAESQGVRVDDLIISVSNVSVRGFAHEALLGLVKSQTRPMTLVFERKGEDQPVAQVDVGSTPTFARLAGSPLLRAPSFLSSGQSMMKSVLGAGAQAVRAIDSTINRAIDDSAKQAKVCINTF